MLILGNHPVIPLKNGILLIGISFYHERHTFITDDKMSQHLSVLLVSVILLFLTFNIYSLTLNKICRSLVALNVYT